MSIDAARFAEITTQMHLIWSGWCPMREIRSELLRSFRSTAAHHGTCFTVQGNAMGDHTWSRIITLHDSYQRVSTKDPEITHSNDVESE